MPRILLLVLHLIVARNDGGVARWRSAVTAALTAMLLLGSGRGGGRGAGSTVVGLGALALTLGLGLSLTARLSVDEDVCDTARLAVLVDGLVLELGLGELGDDVPRVDEAGNLSGGAAC